MCALGILLLTYTCINPKVDYDVKNKYAKPKKGITGYDHLHPDQIKIIETFYDVFVNFFSEFGIKTRLVYSIIKQLYERGDTIHLLIDLVSQSNGEDLFVIFEHVIEQAKERRNERKKNRKFMKLFKKIIDDNALPELNDMIDELKKNSFDITEPIVLNVMKKMFPNYKNDNVNNN